MISVKPISAQDRDWIAPKLIAGWGGTAQAYRGELVNCLSLAGFVAGTRQGLLLFRPFEDDAFDIVLLEAFERGEGIGSALIEAMVEHARHAGKARLVVTTTNDNIDALRFYQDRGFFLLALRPNAMELARKLKPSIPKTGAYGLPVRDEIDLVRTL